jgi:CO/xanthine dehydrogenase Mo-binding subunit
VRFAGDAVALIAAEDEKSALKAMRMIKVEYDVLDAVLDFRTALDNPALVHPEDDWFPPIQVGGDPKRNLVASDCESHGDVDEILEDCDILLERTYHTKAFNQTMMETFTTYTSLDRYDKF